MLPSAELKKIELADYFSIITRRLWLILLFAAVSTLIFFLVLVKPQPKKYETRALFIIGEHPATSAMEIKSFFSKQKSPFSGTEQTLIVGSLTSPEFATELGKKLGVSPRTIQNIVKISPVQTDTGVLGNVIQISAQGRDPVLLAKVVNGWLEELIRKDLEAKKGYSEFGATWLEDSREELAEKLQQSENKLRAFEDENAGIRQKAAALRHLREKKAELQSEFNDLMLKYKDKHPLVVSTERRIDIMDEQIAQLQQTTQGGEEIYFQYDVLAQQVNLYQKMYSQFLDASEKADIAKGLILPSIQVVSTAQVPNRPIFNPKVVPWNVLFGGIVIAIALCFLLEFIDTSLKTPEEVEFYGKMPYLGEVPFIGVPRSRASEKFLQPFIDPSSEVSETFRNIKVSLLFAFPEEHRLTSLLVTSSNHDEGKSIVAANVAISFAMAGEKTVIVDGDIRKGGLAVQFGVEAGKGLSDYVTGKAPAGSVAVATKVPNLDIIASGEHLPNAIDYINADNIKALIKELSAKYAKIIIDGVPLVSFADDLFYANACDAILNVIAKGETSLHDIEAGKKKIDEIETHLGSKAQANVHVFAAVLNNTTRFTSDQKYLKILQKLLKMG